MNGDNSESNATRHVTEYLVTLWYRKWIVLLSFLVLETAGLLAVFKFITPQYQAQARIAIERLRGPVADQTGLAGEAFYQTQYQIIGSSEVAAVAAVKIGSSASRELALEDGSAEAVRSAVVITPERENRVVRIASKQGDPKLAALLVNAVVEGFTEVTRRREETRAGRFQNDLQGQIVQLEMQIEAKKKALDEFAKDKNLQQQQQEQVFVTTKLSALSEAQVRAKVTREQAEKTHADLKARSDAGESTATAVDSNYADQLRIRIKELEQQKRLMELGKTRTALANDPQYAQAGALIDQYQRDRDEESRRAQAEADKETLERSRLGVEQARQVEDILGQQMAEMRERLESLAAGLTALARYTELKKELENLQQWQGDLQHSLMEAKISDSFPVLDIQVLDRAKTPTQPAWPNKAQLALATVVLGFLLAVSLAFFVDYMDRSVRKPEDVEQELRMPLLGFVPSMDSSVAAADRSRIVLLDPSSGAAESYRKIRAKLYVHKRESHMKVICVTSTTAGEGKTTLACNLATAFAQAGARVLLVDGDMRHPALQDVFSIEKDPGLAEYLDGAHPWEAAVHETAVEGLSVLPCGSGGKRSAELLESPRLRDFLEAARDRFDLVIIDTPPVLGVADSTVWCHLADAALFVIQSSRNAKWLVRRARMELEAAGARVAGVVLNRVRTRRGDYYYYHRYYPSKA